MKKFVLVLLVLLLTACGSSSNLETDEQELWDQVVEKEFANYDVWAGHGLYFYEKDGLQYCNYMDYGSGVPVLFVIPSVVTFGDNGELLVSFPYAILSRDLNSQSDWELLNEYSILITDDGLIWEDWTFVESDHPMHEQINN